MAKEAIRVFVVRGGRVQKEPGGDYARVISDRKWPLKKRPVIAHFEVNRNDLLQTK